MEQFVRCIEIKGMAEPKNPGHGVWAFTVITTIGREYYFNMGYVGNKVSSYLAEYRALIEALRYCVQRGWHNITIRSGLNVLVHQVNGRWGVAEDLAPYCQEARLLLDKINGTVVFQENSRGSLAATHTKEAYWQARSGKLKPQPLVLLVGPSKVNANGDEQLQLPLFG